MTGDAQRVMGLDVGERRIGVALSDPDGVLASPLGFIERVSPDADVERVLALARQHKAGRIVVGMPLTLRGQRGPQARAADAFRRSLTTVSDIPVMAWDERLSTVEAERRLREGGTRPSVERGRADAASAAIILQGYLDSRKARS